MAKRVFPEGSVFAHLDADLEKMLESAVDEDFLGGGETLCRQGERGDALYVVLHGRLRAVREEADGRKHVLGEIGRGETVGELSLLLDQPRTATVEALRDTSVLRLPKDAFDRLSQNSPMAMLALSRLVAQRSLGAGVRRRPVLPATITLFPCDHGDVDMRAFCERLLAALAPRKPILVDYEFAANAIGDDKASATARADHGVSFAKIVEDLETNHSLIVYLAQRENTAWTRRCIRQADRILRVVGGNDPGLSEAEAELFTKQEFRPIAREELVRVLPDDTKEPTGTAAFLACRKVAAHHHVRLSVAADYERLARFIAGRPIALALSGGGIRGYAHLGLLRALREAKVPVDLLSGTSGGSIIASQYARGDEPELILENALKGNATNIFDPTLPLVSLIAGFRYRRNLQRVYGDSRLEDTWRPCLLVAADLRAAELVILDEGFSWHAVRASTSVPGVMPPVRWNERMLVDGGVLNNLPVDIVRERGGDPWVIACDVSDPSAGKWPMPYDDAISGFRVFWNRLWKRPSPPGMAEIIARASTLRAAQQVAAIAVDDDVLYLRPSMSGFGTFQMSAVSELVAVGYDSARHAVNEWLAKGRLSANGWA